MSLTPIADLYAALRAIVGGQEGASLTVEQAKAIHAELWDARNRLAMLEQRIAITLRKNEVLDKENADLVGQIVKEERAKVRVEIERAELVALLYEGAQEHHNAKRWRSKAAAWLLRTGTR